jgi:hypothetical protein
LGFSGEFKRAPAERLQALLTDPSAIADELYPCDEPADASAWFTVEKAFDGIRFLLKQLALTGAIPFIEAVPWFAPVPEESMTGAVLHYGPVCYRTPEQTAEIASVLSRLSKDAVRAAFDPQRMTADGIYPETWDRGEEEFEYLWEHLQALTDFYQQAARNGEGLLLWLA